MTQVASSGAWASYLLGNIESGKSENLFAAGMGAPVTLGLFCFLSARV